MSKDNNIEVVVRAIDEFSKAMGDFKSYLKGIDQQSATTEKSVKSLGDRLTGFGNILTGAMRQFGADIFESIKNGFVSLLELLPQAYEAGYQWAAVVQQLQVETGMTAETTSTYAAVMRMMGIDTGATSVILARFSKNVVDSESKFKDLGIATRDSNGQMLDAAKIIENTRARIAELGPSFMGTAAAQDLFGRSGYQMLEFLNLSTEQFQALAQSARDAGMVLDKGTLDAAHRFGIEMGSLQNIITGAQTSIFAGLEPTLERFVDGFSSFIQSNLNQIVGFVVQVSNFVMGLIGNLFGISFNSDMLGDLGGTIAEKATKDEHPGETWVPGSPGVPAKKGTGAKGADAFTVSQQAQIKVVEDQIAALQKLDAAQTAMDRQGDLQQAIADAQDQLAALQGSVLNTYGLSDAERIKAEQKRAADVVTAEKKVADTRTTYAEFQAQAVRQAQIDQLNATKAALQEQLQAHQATAAGITGAIKAIPAIPGHYVKDAASLAGALSDFGAQAQAGLKEGKRLSDWIKTVLIPALQDFAAKVMGIVLAVMGAWTWLNNLLAPLGGFSGILGSMLDPVGTLNKSLGALPGALRKASDAIDNFFNPGHYDFNPFDYLPHFAGGGIVDRPTIAMIGEGRGREAVVPEDQWGSFGGGGGRGPTYLVLDRRVFGQLVDESIGRAMPLSSRRAY